MRKSFYELLKSRWQNSNSLLCVGLDPVIEKLPLTITSKYKARDEQIFQFNKAIIDATAEYVCAFKPNTAFYEAHGELGIKALKQTCNYIRNSYSDIPIIIDAKRGDIGTTNHGYAQYVFEYLEADAITVMPYMGIESLLTYFEYKDRGIIVGCHSSNPGAAEFQELLVDNKPLYHIIAEELMKHHSDNPNCMIFMGATFPQELIDIRRIIGDMTMLVPGVGTQGGDIKTFVQAGVNSKKEGLIISASRSIIIADNPQEEAKNLRDEINQYR